jgi:phospholipid/cholesterol/gamma-HCH transport system substrate-binding protein
VDGKRERVFVGLFVIVATALLLATLFSLTGFSERGEPVYTSYFKNAGGLAPGSEVRYAGGPPVGRVLEVRSDPKDPTLMEIRFRVHSDVPIKTDSKAKISSFGALGDNFLGIVPGSPAAPHAASGAVLPAIDYAGFDELASKINDLAPQATQLLQNLNARVVELHETISRVNDLLDTANRANIAASLANVRGMLEEDRPVVHSTLNNLNATSAKLGPLLDDFKKTANEANEALSHIDATVTENRPDLKQSIAELRTALASASSLTDQLNSTVATNSDNLDEILDNLRRITENLRSFTAAIKTRPYNLIRSTEPPPHKPGEKPNN